MDENNNNNNNQSLQNEESEKMTIPPVKNFDPKLFAAVVVLILVVVGIVITMLGKTQTAEPVTVVPPLVTPEVVEPEKVELGYEKIDYGTSIPENFERKLLPENYGEVVDSYALVYPEGEQLLLILSSDKTAQENFQTYELLTEKNVWYIKNKTETENLYSIYAVRPNKQMNITISKEEGDDSRAMVTISTFNK